MAGIWTWLKRYFSAPADADQPSLQPVATENCDVKPILSQAELALEIRVLIAGGREPSEEELLSLQDRFSRNLACDLPHFIGHWFADADIRRRDVEYSKAQASQLEEALRQMEGSHAI